MKKLLVVAYYFPPIAASGSMRPLGFCRYLDRYGWRPRVLATDPRSVYPPAGVDDSLCKRLPNGMQIDRVPHENPDRQLLQVRNRLRELLRGVRLSRTNGVQPLADESVPKRVGDNLYAQYFCLREIALEWLFSFPDPQCSWLRPAVRRLSQIPRAEYPDVVFATGGPWTALLVGKALAEKFSVPFVADFRDPWTYNPDFENRSRIIFRKARRVERSICEAAARVITNTDELRAKLLTDYPTLKEKFLTITNGFDSYVDSQIGNRPENSDENVLELCHFGSIYGNRKPLALLQAIKELIDEGELDCDRLKLRFIGPWEATDAVCEKHARDLEERGILRREPPVSYDECGRQMTTAKVLLILQPDFPLQIPGKIYEYIATGRPLLVIGGDGATAHLVEQRQLGICCPNQVSDIKAMLSLLVTGQTQIAPPRKEEQARFEYRTLAGDLASVLDTACAAK
jgi:glycosyltransferase involved in cell wall biosynthesis